MKGEQRFVLPMDSDYNIIIRDQSSGLFYNVSHIVSPEMMQKQRMFAFHSKTKQTDIT